MEDRHVTSLRDSFNLLAPAADQLVDTFYTDLFDAAPSVRSLFPDDMAKQKKALIGALAWVVGNLTEPKAFREGLLAMGERHGGYGAESAHYPVVRDVLLGAMGKLAGDVWTRSLQADWRAALDVVAGIMIEGQARASARRAA
jgi:methyl-accepting chemotaxis protein